MTWHNRRSLWKLFARIASSLAVRNPGLRAPLPVSELCPRVGVPTVVPLQLTRQQRELDRSCL